MADAAEPTPPAEGEAKPRNPLIPVVGALVVGLLVGGGAGMFGVGPVLAAGIAPAGATAGAHKVEGDSADAEGGDEEEASGDHKKKEGEGAEEPAALIIENIVLNPAGSDGTRFLLLSLAFETKSAEVTDELKRRDAEVRDVVLSRAGAKTTEALATMAVREALKQEIADAVTEAIFAKNPNKKLRKQPIKRVYFPQYVIQ